SGAGVCTPHDHHVGVHQRVKGLRTGGLTQGRLKTVAGRGATHAGTGVHVTGTKGGTNQLFHQNGCFVGATRGGDAAHRVTTVLILNATELGGSVIDGLVPRHFLPGVRNALAYHGAQDTVLVRGVTPGETTFHAGVATVGLAVFPGCHANDFVALHLGLEAATDTAIGAGGDDGVLGLTQVDNRLFHQGRSRAGLDTSTAGDAIAAQKTIVLAGSDARFKTTLVDGQCKGALNFLT